MTGTRKHKRATGRSSLSKTRLDRCLYTMIEHSLALPLETTVLGVPVSVERIHLRRQEEIVAVCRRASVRQTVPLLDLPLPSPPPAGTEWIAAYRRWLGVG